MCNLASRKILIVKNLPSKMTSAERIDLLKYMGAIDVRLMSCASGRLRNCAFATFSSEESAYIALHKLHQTQLFGSTLSAEFARDRHRHFYKEDRDKHSAYKYPEITDTTAANIVTHLKSNPGFYTQVCHLMNKMRLPPPFEAKQSDETEIERGAVFEGFFVEGSDPPPAKRQITLANCGDQSISKHEEGPGTKEAKRTETLSVRLPREEVLKNPIFNESNLPLSPNCKLYIKNLSKSVTEEDLRSLFAGLTWDDQEERTFSVQAPGRGRMRNQAFVCFGSTEAATKAKDQTNGVILKGKPIVVNYSRYKKD